MKKFWRKCFTREVLEKLAFFLGGLLSCLLLLLAFFGGTELFFKTVKFGSILRLVDKNYIGEFDAGEFTDTALSAGMDTLDRWSYYMTAEEYDDYSDFANNRYAGIGVTIRADEASGGFEIVALTKDGPAARVGVEIGEIIVACGGVDVTGMTTEELKYIIQSANGLQLELILLAPDKTQRAVVVSCEYISVDPVSYSLMENGVGYIRLENFEAGMARSAIAAVDALMQQGAEGIVFDVRSNPGGRVTELCQLLDYLLPEGDIFVHADEEGHERVERSDDAWVDIPLAVVVDSSSYSAAEFFAAALQEADRAAVAGTATTGKGRSQVTYILPDGSAVHLSTQRYLTPGRVDLSEAGGLVPDAPAALNDEQQSLFAAGQLAPEDDPQVQAAVSALRP